MKKRIMKKTLLARAGTNAAIARALGISPPAVSQWGIWVPVDRVAQLAKTHPEWLA